MQTQDLLFDYLTRDCGNFWDQMTERRGKRYKNKFYRALFLLKNGTPASHMRYRQNAAAVANPFHDIIHLHIYLPGSPKDGADLPAGADDIKQHPGAVPPFAIECGQGMSNRSELFGDLPPPIHRNNSQFAGAQGHLPFNEDPNGVSHGESPRIGQEQIGLLPDMGKNLRYRRDPDKNFEESKKNRKAYPSLYNKDRSECSDGDISDPQAKNAEGQDPHR